MGDGGGAFVLLRQEEADGHEEFVDADSELLLVLAARGQREEAAGLDDVLEDVLAGLEGRRANIQGRIHYYCIILYLDGRGLPDINDQKKRGSDASKRAPTHLRMVSLHRSERRAVAAPVITIM